MNDTERERIAAATREAVLKAMETAYEEAGQSGLCAEGRWELAIDRARSLDLDALLKEKHLLATDEHG